MVLSSPIQRSSPNRPFSFGHPSLPVAPRTIPEPLAGEEETNPRIFYSDLFQSAQWQFRRQNFEAAGRALRRIADSPDLPRPLRERARRWQRALTGTGGLTPERFQFLTDQIFTEMFRPSSLGSMAAAGLTYRWARLGLMRGFLGAGMTETVVPHLAGLLAFGMEASVFPVYTRLLENSLGHRVDWSGPSLLHDLQESFLILGSLRLARFGGTRLFNWVHGHPPVLPGTAPLVSSLHAFQNGSLFAGIVLGHRMEQSLGLQPDQDLFQLLSESLITMVHFKGAERILAPLTEMSFVPGEPILPSPRNSFGGPTDGRRQFPDFLLGLRNPWSTPLAFPEGFGIERGEISSSQSTLNRPQVVLTLGASPGGKSATPELARLIETLRSDPQDQDPALLPASAERFSRTLKEFEAGHASRTEVNQRLGEILQEDWIQRMKQIGIRVTRRPLVPFFREKFVQAGRMEPDWLKNVAEDPYLREMEITELFADATAHENAKDEIHQDTLTSFEFHNGVMEAIGKRLHLPSGTFLQVTSLYPQEFRTYLAPIPFLLNLPHAVFGESALGYEITPALSDPLEVRDLMTRGLRPWLVTDRFSNLHEQSRIHPYPAWIHDLFHIIDLSRIPAQTRRTLPVIFDYFSGIRPTNEGEAKLIQEVLPFILEGELTSLGSHEPLFHLIRNSKTSNDFRTRLQSEIEEIITP